MLLRSSLFALEVGLKCLEAADQVVQKVPCASGVRALVLDTLFGPEETLDYVSTTSPPTLSPQ